MARAYTVEVKKGTTFSFGGTVSLPSGTWTAKASVKDVKRTIIDELEVTLTAPVNPSTDHTILLEASATVTGDWVYGRRECDIRYQDSTGFVISSPTFYIDVVKEITNADD
jgi:hypothetical protein